ncbi:MAG: choloylglycine hydrolase family protein [Lachnospiraceae bacterium]|jgi:penicillin V acylase-like amidase (Ntn superfamily)|nr:choloylglycine hydrolase family protein [Lachnospiraceae bacterium]
MCTAATYETKDFYFGRTLDNDFSYGEEVVVTPREYRFSFSRMGEMNRHYAMVGMAHVEDDQPLYYEAVNEKGLGMAGLNFVGNAWYGPEAEGKENIATFELIPWILGQCARIQEARALLEKIKLTDLSFHGKLPPAQLHWMIADSQGALVVEAMKDGLHVYDNPAGVLTNNPPFPEQMFCLNNYMHLSPREPENHFSSKLNLHTYCRGMGALGLPGDLSSQSRFVRAAFVKLNSCSGDSEAESVSQFFHILGSVDQQRGCSQVGDEKYEMTIYTCCCNASKGIYYYNTYDNHQITAVDMYKEPLDSRGLIRYPLVQGEQIYRQN